MSNRQSMDHAGGHGNPKEGVGRSLEAVRKYETLRIAVEHVAAAVQAPYPDVVLQEDHPELAHQANMQAAATFEATNPQSFAVGGEAVRAAAQQPIPYAGSN
jgi:hypothetical protein